MYPLLKKKEKEVTSGKENGMGKGWNISFIILMCLIYFSISKLKYSCILF